MTDLEKIRSAIFDEKEEDEEDDEHDIEYYAENLICPHCQEQINYITATQNKTIDITYKLSSNNEYQYYDEETIDSEEEEIEYKCAECGHYFEEEIIEAIDNAF